MQQKQGSQCLTLLLVAVVMAVEAVLDGACLCKDCRILSEAVHVHEAVCHEAVPVTGMAWCLVLSALSISATNCL
jgi:hypothetical protein